jgi:outer membrane translocation and assembly module TamA
MEWQGLDQIGAAFLGLIKKKAAISEGDLFSSDSVHESEGMLLNRLHDMSFAFASVESQVEAYPEEHAVDLRIVANTGPACRFGPVTITGDYSVPEEFIRSEVTISEGAAFRASTLADTQRRLFALGIFSMVNVVPDLSEPGDQIIPVRLELSESKARQLRLGVGVQIESGKQDVHGLAEFQHVNVFQRLWNLTTRARPGYGWIGSLDALDAESSDAEQSPTAQASMALTIPHFPARGFELTNTLDGEYGLEEGYKFLSPSYGPDLSYAVNRKLSVRLGYNIRFFKYIDLSADDSIGKNRFGLNFTNPYVLSSLEQEITWNTRDNALFPSTGEYVVASLKEAGGPLGGGFNYLEARTDVRVFRRVRRLLSFRPNVTIGMRAGGGVMIPYESSSGLAEVPFAERLKLGGASDVRGWTRAHLGPYLCDAETYTGGLDLDDPVNAARCAGLMGRAQQTDAIQPIGGTVYLHGTIELRKYTVADYGVAVFNDWGMVWNSAAEVDILELLPSAGVGLRYKSPIGAIRLDGAYRFNIEPMFELEPAFQVHFGLSEAF